MLQAFAKPAYLSHFLFYGMLSVAPYCVPGGVRAVSGADSGFWHFLRCALREGSGFLGGSAERAHTLFSARTSFAPTSMTNASIRFRSGTGSVLSPPISLG